MPALSAALRMGAHGGIGSFYNIAPDLVVALPRAHTAGNTAGTERVQAQMNLTIQVVRGYRLIPADSGAQASLRLAGFQSRCDPGADAAAGSR